MHNHNNFMQRYCDWAINNDYSVKNDKSHLAGTLQKEYIQWLHKSFAGMLVAVLSNIETGTVE